MVTLTDPSPNFGPRRGTGTPALVVIHYTAMTSAEAACRRLCDPTAEVSAHWLIARDGAQASLVDESARAWHAGAGSWAGCDDLNSVSIGIELDNDGFSPFPEAQMAALEGLLDGIRDRWGIGPEAVIGHSDMAPGRKIDPGARFDWRRLARGGRAVWPVPTDPVPTDPVPTDPVPDVPMALRSFGYTSEVDDDVLLAAFRLRFRPGVEGPLTEADRALAGGLACLPRVDLSGFSA